MKRKIIKLGQATFVTTLPSKWIKKYNLEKGDYLEVEEKEEYLLVSTQKVTPSLEISMDIDVSNYNRRAIIIILHQAYRKGFDKLMIKHRGKEQLELIRNITKQTLLGFEVVKEEGNVCIIQNIAEPSADKFDIILRKLMLLIKEDVQDIHTLMKEGKKDGARRKEIKETFDNFNNFVRRTVIRDKIQGPKDSYLLFYLISQLSLLQHAYFHMYKIYEKKTVKTDSDFLGLLEKANKAYALLYDSFYRKDIMLAHDTRNKADDVLDEITEKIQKSTGVKSQMLLLLANIARTIAVSTTALFGLGFKDPDKMMK